MRSLRSLAAMAFFWPGRVNFAQSPAAIYLGSSRRNRAQADQRVAAPHVRRSLGEGGFSTANFQRTGAGAPHEFHNSTVGWECKSQNAQEGFSLFSVE
jgi:hypothetical protein